MHVPRRTWLLCFALVTLGCFWAPFGAMGQLPPAPSAASSPDPAATEAQDADPLAGLSAELLNNPASAIQRLQLRALWSDNTWKNWTGLLAAIFVGLLAGRIAASVLGQISRRFESRGWIGSTHLVHDAIGPAKLALLTVGLTVGLAVVKGMSSPLNTFWWKTLLLLYSISVFWYAFNLVVVVEIFLRRVTAKTGSNLDDQLAPLIRKTLRIFLVIVGVMFVVDSVFDQDIGAWLAGLGIAGLAVSLAAQDSLKNLFGSLTVLLDRPFGVGERIIYAGYDGVIEEIGFRSTKMRTLTGNLVTIPNSNIVNSPVENVARRPSIRRIMNITITYDTPREKVERAVQILRDILEEDGIREPIHATIGGDDFPPRVFFNDYNADSLNIFLIYWFAPPEWWPYMEHAQRLNLRIFEEFEKAGIEFAFPTQTLFLAGDPNRQLAVKTLGPGV